MNDPAPSPRSGPAWPYVLACAVILLALGMYALYAGTPTIPYPPVQKLDQQTVTVVTPTPAEGVSTLRRVAEIETVGEV